MFKRNKFFDVDMLAGPIYSNLIAFSLPLMASSMLQLLYNAADIIVVGRFTGPDALAAVGSCASLINLIINLFLGLSVGANVVIARDVGAGDYKSAREAVHSSVVLAVLGGTIIGIFGYIFGGTFLNWMGSPETVLPLATQYIKIYFIGMPFNMLYNFGAAVLRSVGDTRHPLYFLTLAGVVNVALNLILVIVFDMGVAGVALATIASQALSAVLVLICLFRSEGVIHLELKRMRISMRKLSEMMRIGLPAGIQSCCFSISNVLIQSTVNSFGAIVVAANSASCSIENFVYAAMNSVHQAAVTFVSANVGAGNNRRMRECMRKALVLVFIIGCSICALFMLLRTPLLKVYTTEDAVVEAGYGRLTLILWTYWIFGIMDVLCGAIRGLGASITPLIVSLMGICVFRIFWIYAILPFDKTYLMLMVSYPISWVLTVFAHYVCVRKRLKRFPVENEKQ